MFKSCHLVGICGIGMSGLAQFARSLGIEVSGSDRALEKPENAGLKTKLQAQGIRLYAQDGSRFAPGEDSAEAIIYSSAVEENNPDFAASGNIERIHRATALRDLILERTRSGKSSIAVAGSCGKTSTTAMIAEALCNLHADAESINGGMIKAFAAGNYPGNYRCGNGPLVFEADESDKSLLAFHPDYALVLNIGTDHYPKDELTAMFAQFINQAKKGAVLHEEVFALTAPMLRKDLPVVTFSAPLDYRTERGESYVCFGDQICRKLPAPGVHTALNAAAAVELLKLMQYPAADAWAAVLNTHGVARRFDCKGRTASGAIVYDDYAHNPEKVANILATAQELSGDRGRVWALFQPHGYGPFGFMADELGKNLYRLLRKQDKLFLAEPYYAGGSSSFSPHAAEVLSQWQSVYGNAMPVILLETREKFQQTVMEQAGPDDLILIMGARDNTLSEFADTLTR